MKISAIAAIAVLASAGAAFAAESEDIQRAMEICLPSLAEIENASATIDMEIASDGTVSSYRVSGLPSREIVARTLEGSAVRALLRCAPYDVSPGVYRVVLEFGGEENSSFPPPAPSAD